jgi:uncharacterized protein YcbX
MAKVTALHVYPIKSCRGLSLKSSRFDVMGPLYDRRFMVVDPDGNFLTQREHPRMALIEPQLAPTTLNVKVPDMPLLKMPATTRSGERREVQIWGGRGDAEDVGDHAADWFSSFLERPCRVVRFPDDGFRPVDSRYARFEARVAFADGFPALLTSEASLKELNARASEHTPMNRFRPNIVIDGDDAFAEDGWRQIRIGEVLLDVVKPCGRCTITTVNQLNAKTGKEPLATLATFRKRDNEVHFGQNCVHHGPGTIRLGDEVEIVESAEV